MLYLFYQFGIFTKVPQVPHPLQNRKAQNKKVLEGIFSSSLIVVSFVGRPLINDFIVIGFPFVAVLFPSSLPEICSLSEEHVRAMP